MGYYWQINLCLAVRLLALRRLPTLLVITGDCRDRLKSPSSGLRASYEPHSGRPTAVQRLEGTSTSV